MQINKLIVDSRVSIGMSQYDLTDEALQTILFITEDVNVDARKAIVAFELNDLLNAGYRRDSIAYNFCFGVFLQQRGIRIILINKPKDVSYLNFYKKEIIKDSHYFVCIESKDSSDIIAIDEYFNETKLEKLIFTSTSKDLKKEYINCSRVVYYYLGGFNFDDFYENFILLDSWVITQTDNQDDLVLEKIRPNTNNNEVKFLLLDDGEITNTDLDDDVILEKESVDDISVLEAQSYPLYYPEGAWIARCAKYFPSKIQWLYKSFRKQNTNNSDEIPDNSTTSSLCKGDNVATNGCGTLSNLTMTINERIGLDWLCIAIRRKLWSVLYNNERIKSDKYGEDKLTTSLISVLNKSVELDLLKDWKSLKVNLDKNSNTISYKFEMQTTQSLLSIMLGGNVYY